MKNKYYYRDEEDFLTVKVPIDVLRQYCLWIIAKFGMDKYHQQQNSSRRDLLGGFMDRWLNRIPEYLIFDSLLDENINENKNKNEDNIKIVNDNFFYNKESAKNAPDILGLVKNFKSKKNYYPFTKFNNNQWIFSKKNAPHIEMKTFRESQKLITIPVTQFDQVDIDCFYAFVISYIEENYLIYLLDRNIFKNFEFESNQVFISSNNAQILKEPNNTIKKEIENYNKLINNPKIGKYKLIGIFDSDTIKNYSIKASTNDEDKPEKPRYLKSIDEIIDKNIQEINSDEIEYYTDSLQAIPILLDIPEDSVVSLLHADENKDIILVSGKINIYDINGELIDSKGDGCYKFNFESFIYNLKKYYNFISIKPENYSIDKSSEIIELKSGIYLHKGDTIINNNFDLNNLFESGFEVYDYTNKSISFHVNNNINDKIKKGFNRFEFKDNGDLKEEKNYVINEINNKLNLPSKNSAKNFSFKLIIDISKDSSLKFIKKNLKSFEVCINGTVTISDNHGNKFTESDGIYKFKINDGTSRINNPNFDLKKPTEQKKINSRHIEKKSTKLYINTLDLDENGFYYPDKHNDKINAEDKKNVKFKVDCSDGEIYIVKIGQSKENYETYYNIQVKGKVIIDGTVLEDYSICQEKIWKLTFDTFERTSKKEEFILSRGSISHFGTSLEKELIKKFEDFMVNEDNLN